METYYYTQEKGTSRVITLKEEISLQTRKVSPEASIRPTIWPYWFYPATPTGDIYQQTLIPMAETPWILHVIEDIPAPPKQTCKPFNTLVTNPVEIKTRTQDCLQDPESPQLIEWFPIIPGPSTKYVKLQIGSELFGQSTMGWNDHQCCSPLRECYLSGRTCHHC